MIQDLHSHTYYSFCGKDRPEQIVEAAIDSGIELFGICDHNYGIGIARKDFRYVPEAVDPDAYTSLLVRYFDHIRLVREKYARQITLLCGIEVATESIKPYIPLPDGVNLSFFDYCLIEHIDRIHESIAHGNLFAFAERCGTPAVGVAHTDLFAFIKTIGEDPYRYFKRMAEQNIFWEMNVNCDSTHHYREHAYVKQFFSDPEQQAIIQKSGVRLSVGFDGHRVEEYRPDRVKDACRALQTLGIPLAFED